LEGSLLVTVTDTGAAAGAGSEIARVPDVPRATDVLAGTVIVPALCTVTLAVASAIFGRALAWITVVPTATPVTGTFTVLAPAAKVTVLGTVAVAGALELRLTVIPPAGAAADRFNVRFCVLNPLIVRELGVKLTVAFTCTLAEFEVKPVADALIVADPNFRPLICGCAVGVVWPAWMVTVVGDMLTMLLLVLDNVTVTVETAACGSVTAKVAWLPSATVGLVGRMIDPAGSTVTVTAAGGRFGAAVLAVIVAGPKATVVTGTLVVVAPAANVTVAGTVATFVAFETRLIVKPPAGAAPDSVNVRF
jgi:hypothetical protein